ncbi:MAG: PQQ-binding-like beta-propeller repeat protein [Thermoplasmatota archaeon]
MGAFSSSVSASQPDEESITSLSETGWPGFGFDEKNTHQSPYNTSHVNGSLKWSFDMSNWVWSSAAISEEGTLYIGSTDGNLYAINSTDGNLIWSFETGDDIVSSPAIDEQGNIYVGSQDNHLYSLYPNGTLRWEFETDGMIHSSPAISQNGTVYVGSDDTYFYGISQSGNLRWKYKADSWFWSSPAIDDDGTVYVGCGDKNLYAFNPNGTLEWNFTTRGFIYSSPAIGNDRTIYFGSYDGKLYALSPQGDKIWSYNFGDEVVSSPAISSDGTVYIGTHDKSLHAIYPNGTHRWEFETNGHVKSSPAVGANGNLYFGSYDGHVYALDHEGNERWNYDTGWEIYASPSIGPNGDIYLGSWDSNLYAFTGSNSPPNAEIDVWQEVQVNLTIAGRPGNDISAEFYENDELIDTLEVERTRGAPNTTISTLNIELQHNYTMNLSYNATSKGANPTWVTFRSGEDSNRTIFKNFNGAIEDEQEVTLDINEELSEVAEHTYYFSAAKSSDPDGEIISYQWDLDDGSDEAGMIVSNEYDAPGNYLIELTVTDEQGNTDSSAHTLVIGEGDEHEGEENQDDIGSEQHRNRRNNREQHEEKGTVSLIQHDPMKRWTLRKSVKGSGRMHYIYQVQKVGDLAQVK